MKFSSCFSIQLAVCCHRNFAIKFVCNAKLYSFLVDVLENAVPADVKIGNNEEFIMFMLSNNFTLKHLNQNITDINLCNCVCNGVFCSFTILIHFQYIFLFKFKILNSFWFLFSKGIEIYKV